MSLFRKAAIISATLVGAAAADNWDASAPGNYVLPGNAASKLVIGATAAQDRTLTVIGNVGVYSSNSGILLKNTASSNKIWELFSSGNNLNINESGVGTRMTFLAGGNVGIGTTAPSALLNVSTLGSAVGENRSIARFGNRIATGRTAELSVDYRGQTYGDGALVLREDRAGVDFLHVQFVAGNSKVVLPNGNVGIGQVSPAAKLDVNGNLNVANRATINGTTVGQEALVVNQTQAAAIADFRKSGASVVTITDAGRLGIGTKTPGVMVDISGTHVDGLGIIRASSASHAMIMANAAAGANQAGLRLANNNVLMWDIVQNEGGSGNNLAFTNGTTRHLTIARSNGNVGIGTDPTGFKLDVNGMLNVANRANINGTTAGQEVLIVNQAQTGAIADFRKSGASVVTITDAGRLGIGTNTPGVMLDISGTHVDGLGIIRASSANHAMIMANAAAGANQAGLRLANNNVIMWDIVQNEGGNGNNLAFSNGTTRHVAIARSTGNVGIGTDPTGFKLDVNGAANISGNLTVAGVTTKVWSIAPDYVFEKDYDLKPLAHVERFIYENKHLPEIPSGKEIESKGIDLADMNMKLLRKVEELTLYSIQQNKQIDKQNKDISSLMDRLSKLENTAGGSIRGNR